jgi:hypothetical protein
MLYTIFYELLPPLLFAIIVYKLPTEKIPEKILLAACMSLALLSHVFYAIANNVFFTGDSPEYILWMQNFFHAKLAAVNIRRAPMYPLFLYFFIKSGLGIHAAVLIQHVMTVLYIPLTWSLAKQLGLNSKVRILCAFFIAWDPLFWQMGQQISQETLSAFAVLVCAIYLVSFNRHTNTKNALLMGVFFSISSHIRSITDIPFYTYVTLFTGLAISRKDFGKVKLAILAFAAFILCNLPFSLHNYFTYGLYARSEMTGVYLLIKPITYGYLDTHLKIPEIFYNAYRSSIKKRGLTENYVSRDPLNDWSIDAIPHDIQEELTVVQGMNYKEANKVMEKAAILSIAFSPVKYVKSVWADLYNLFFKCSEYTLSPNLVFCPASSMHNGRPDNPENYPGWFLVFFRVARGLLHPSSWLLILGFLAWITIEPRRDKFYRVVKNNSFTICMLFLYGFLFTACINIGLTRLTLPWLPLKIILIGQSLYLIVIAFKNAFRTAPRIK